MKVLSANRRVERFLARHLRAPAYGWGEITDPRAKRGRRWQLGELLNAALLGFMSGCRTLRGLEDLTEDFGAVGRRYVHRRVPDTTEWDLLGRLSTKELRLQHVCQVRLMWRAKKLEPVGLPCGIAAIDGKGLGALEHDANGTAQKAHRSHDGSEYYLARYLRAVLVSAESKPALDQMPIRAKTNEMGDFTRFFRRLMKAYGENNDLIEGITVDAGLCSKANADVIHRYDRAYIMALKGPQAELLAEAERLLGRRTSPDAETDWERHKGKLIKRRFFRTDEIAGYHDWHHLRQAWRVEQIVEDKNGNIEKEQRYFLTSFPWGRLSPAQCLLVVRLHWGIENDCFWTLDTQWKEDFVPWCSRGRAVEVLSWLRLMAYNLLQLARRKSLRKKLPDGNREPPPPWSRVFAWVHQAWQLHEETSACR
jgi:predicted transposase YbfD/YdcC